MSRRSHSPALLALLLAACGQAGAPPSQAPAAGAPSAPAARAAAAPASAAARPPSFTVLAQGKGVLGAAPAAAAVPRGTAAAPVHMDHTLGVPTFMWAQPGTAAGAVAAARARAPAGPYRSPVEAARAHLAGAAAAYRLTASDTARAEAARVHDLGQGPIVVSFRQRPGGVEVLGESANVLMARDLSLVAITGALSPADPKAAALSTTWAIDAPSALALALTDLTGEAFAAGDFEAAGANGPWQRWTLRPEVAAARAERLPQPASLRKVWFRLPAGLMPAWQVESSFQRLGEAGRLAYGSVLSAADGTLLERQDREVHAAYTYRVWASDVAPFLPDDGPQGLAGTPHPTGLADGYQAPFVDRKLVTLQSLPFSRNDPWLPDGATQTFGNNVHAYADLAAPDHFDLGDTYGLASGPGAFDWAYDLALPPRDPALPPAADPQVQAAIVQLFYVGNALHDWFYDVGFQEVDGNAQDANFGRGGLGSDPLILEAQDHSGVDNAVTNPRPDGVSPWIEMYLWTNGVWANAAVTAPADLAGTRAVRVATFGPQSFDVAGDLAIVQRAGTGDLNDGCGAVTNAAEVAGKIALVNRGTCDFVVKVKNAQDAGAAGVLVRNVLDTQVFFDMIGADPAIVIPALLIGKADGDAIAARLATAAVSVTLRRSAGLMRDGSADTVLIAHEWAHFMSNRLVQDASGLWAFRDASGFDVGQAAAMGEGWSDFVALLLAVREEDAQVAANAGWAGIYAPFGFVSSGLDTSGLPNQGYYYGLRRTPYSTDMTRAPLTFRHVVNGAPLPPVSPPLAANGAPNAEVHNAGEVWAGALWECYAALLRDTQGPAPRLTFAEANLRMRHYLVASLKLLPRFPTFLEGRDALLAAARADDLADFQAFWVAFAKRGFGLGAVGPASRYSTSNAGVVESFGAGGQLAFEAATFGGVTSGCDDMDGILDDGETGTLFITLRNYGSAALPAGEATISTPSPAVSFPDGGRVRLAATPLDGTSVATARVSLTGAAPGELVQFTVTFPDGYQAQAWPVDFQLRTDVDSLRDASAADDLEGERFLWTPGALVAPATGERFRRVASSASSHYAWGPDADGTSDLTLTSPPLRVGAGPFTASWSHLFRFEADPAGTPDRLFYDGGVVELSDDAGATWRDVGGPLYNGTLAVAGPGYVSTNPLAGRAAFVDASPSAGGEVYDRVTLDLSTACAGGSCAGRTVLFRFRVGSDQAVPGPRGWLIDDVAFGGITNTPFDLVVSDARRCVNRPPAASAGASQAVDEGAAVTLDASGSSDPDAGTTLTYAWTQTAGPAVTLSGAATAHPTFTAPAVDADTTLAFAVTVSDGAYAAGASTLVTVRNVNRPPVASAGPAQAVDERTLVTLDGSASADPDPGTVLTYAWRQVGAPAVTLLGATGANPTFVAPEVTADTTLTFELVVRDGQADSAPAQVTVQVRNVNRPPVAVVGGLQEAAEGAAVSLSAAGSADPDGTPVTYAWSRVGPGPAVVFTGADTATPSFTAPQVDADTLLTFQVAVSDGVATTTATTSVLVRNVNATPVADAGAAQVVAERSLVTLDGRASADADPGTALQYAWTQVGTPAVALLGAGGPRPSFSAPEVGPEGAILTFQLVVSDGRAESAPSTVRVTVTNVNRPPVASAGPDFTVDERATVFLAAEASDPDAGATVSVSWAQVGLSTVVLTGADTLTPSFTAPDVGAPTQLTFEVTARDDLGATATSRVTVTVVDVNRAPVAQAGAAQTVNAGTVVHLDAAGSRDLDAGATLTYAWTQTAGPAVSLTGADTAAPSFTAPGGPATLAFQVMVSDGQAIDTASVEVTVLGGGGGGGCGCAAGSSNPAGLVPFLLGLALLRRRRARPEAG